MAYRNKAGTLRMKARFGFIKGIEVGTIDVSLGTKTEYWAEKYEWAVRSLAEGEAPRPDLLLAVKQGKWTPEQIYNETRIRKISGILNINHPDTDLREALDLWLEKAETQRSKPLMRRTKESYKKMIKQITKEAFAPKKAVVRDLPAIFTRFREHYYSRGSYRTVNKGKALCLSFVRETQEGRKHSDLYKLISAVKGAPSDIKQSGQGLTVWEVVEIIAKIESEAYRQIATFQAFTGALASECVAGFIIYPHHIHIKGEKNAFRVRDVPRLLDFSKKEGVEQDFAKELSSDSDYREYNRVLRKVSADRITQKHFRATYHQWLKDAGLDRERIRRYIGHKQNEVVDSYSKPGKVKEAENLRRDTERLVQYIEDHWEKPKEEPVSLPPIRLQKGKQLLG